MTFQINPSFPLPKFRSDLTLYKGPLDIDGSPTYSLFDPVRAQYYKISWRQSLILKSLRPGITLNELQQELNAQYTAKVTKDDIKSFFEDAIRYDLLETQKSSAQLNKEIHRTHTGYLQKLFFKYLYVRIPLFQPDRFLNKTLPYVLPLASKPALITYFIFTVIGLALLIDRFAEYVNTFAYFFNFNGFLIYLVGIIFFKMVHELAHAYTACYHKVHVPSMGVALILMVPVLYTDTTDGWKLSKRSDRLKISAAGLISEIILAGLCTFGWAFTTQGALHSLFFVVSSVLWLSSLLINMNPAMRYDGYFLLSDWLGIDNLQSRAFNFTRWWVQYAFFGIERVSPDEDLSRKMKIFFVVYSLYTWIYRLFFYIGLAILLYLFSKNYKLIGVFIFISTLYTLVLLPIYTEVMEIIHLKKQTPLNIKSTISVALMGILIFICLFPLPKSYHVDGVAISTQEQIVYAPEDSQIEKIYVSRGQEVEKGQPLILFNSDTQNANINSLQVKKNIVEKEIQRFSLTSRELPLVKETNNELASIEVQLNKLYEANKMLNVTSEISGYIISWDPKFKEGQYVHKGARLGTIAHPSFKVVAYVPENYITYLKTNKKVTFRSNRSLKTYVGHIENIHPVRTEYLTHPALASIYKGDIPVIATKEGTSSEKLKLVESLYEVDIVLDNPKEVMLFGELGTVKMTAPWNSYLDYLLQSLQRLFWRESGI